MLRLLIDAKTVRILMVEKDIRSVSALARLSGLHENTLYDMLNGDRFNSQSVERLAASLGVSPLSLLKEVADEAAKVPDTENKEAGA
jgi:hypothetical protein